MQINKKLIITPKIITIMAKNLRNFFLFILLTKRNVKTFRIAPKNIAPWNPRSGMKNSPVNNAPTTPPKVSEKYTNPVAFAFADFSNIATAIGISIPINIVGINNDPIIIQNM